MPKAIIVLLIMSLIHILTKLFISSCFLIFMIMDVNLTKNMLNFFQVVCLCFMYHFVSTISQITVFD